MFEFSYEAFNEANEVTSGRVSAENVAAAIHEIEEQGLRVTSIQQIAVESIASGSQATADSIASDDQQALRQHIAKVLEKRDILAPALAAFAEELPRGRSRRALRQLAERLQAGATVEQLCNSDDSTLSWLLLLGGGVGSHRFLSDLFAEATRESESRTQWARALAYPLFVFAAALGVFVFLCVAVVPTFGSIFLDFDLNLPGLTQGVLAVSDMILQRPVAVVLAIVAVGATIYAFFRLISVWGLLGRVGSALSTGNSRQVNAMARFTRRLAESLDAGLTLPSALRLASRAEGRSTTRHAVLQLAREAEQKNFDLNKSTWARRLPATVVHALRAGPDNRPNIPLLQQLGELYAERVRDRCNWSTGFMAQFAIVAMGLTVGVVALSLLVPLVQLINGLTG